MESYPKQRTLKVEYVVDAVLGAVTVVLLVLLVPFFGGFNFFLPWLVAAAALFFLVGFIRGKGDGSIGLKTASLSLGPILFLSLASDVLTAVAGTILILAFASTGLRVRRFPQSASFLR